MLCLRGGGDLGRIHMGGGGTKNEKEGRDAAWGPKQETDVIYTGGGAGRYEERKRKGGGTNIRV